MNNLEIPTWIRVSLLILAGAILWFFIEPLYELRRVFMIIAYLELMAIAMSSMALFFYTKFNFLRAVALGEDNKLNEKERIAILNVIGYVFLGVHILVGLTFYITQFADKQ